MEWGGVWWWARGGAAHGVQHTRNDQKSALGKRLRLRGGVHRLATNPAGEPGGGGTVWCSCGCMCLF